MVVLTEFGKVLVRGACSANEELVFGDVEGDEGDDLTEERFRLRIKDLRLVVETIEM